MRNETNRSSATSIVLAWLVVGAPLGWGIYNTLLGALKLFQTHG